MRWHFSTDVWSTTVSLWAGLLGRPGLGHAYLIYADALAGLAVARDSVGWDAMGAAPLMPCSIRRRCSKKLPRVARMEGVLDVDRVRVRAREHHFVMHREAWRHRSLEQVHR